MADPFLAEIRMVGFNFPPRGWAECDGQTLPIVQNTALFALLGTQFGGNGITTFALPDLRARCAIGAGQGPGLTSRPLGGTGGDESVTLTTAHLPAHQHGVRSARSTTTASPAGALLAPTANGSPAFRGTGATVSMSAESVGPAGASQPHGNRQPYQAVLFVIAMLGIFPPRS